MKCKHQFIKLNEVSKMNGSSGYSPASTTAVPVTSNSFTVGSLAVCAECGEVRAIYADGEIRIIVRPLEKI